MSTRQMLKPQSESERAAGKASQLRGLLTSPTLSFLMEAHDGLSAKIAEDAGFKGIWASGLAISSALGVRDSNEASWTQVLEVLEFMSDATSIPILVDGDTGYGNFNSVRRVVRKLCQRGLAGICIEDKLFPKTNSFIGEGQPLADIHEFCGKIAAGKDSQSSPDFCLVARTEALIAGWGVDEALRRAEAYRVAGADAVLVHSKRSDASEIFEFQREWGGRLPVVIVPTTYHGTPTQAYRDAGISMVIWANHNLRASINAMREVCRQIQRDESLGGVEGSIASLKDVFEIAGNRELAEAEKRYQPPAETPPQAILLAASRGAQLGELTADRPKCMIDVRGQPLLRRLCTTLRDGGVRDIVVVRGYCKEKINLPTIRTADNDDHATTGAVASLACAVDMIEEDCIVAYGDILFRQHLLDRLLNSEGDIVLVVDALWRERQAGAGKRELVSTTRPFTPHALDEEPPQLIRMGTDLDQASVCGEWIGMARMSRRGCELVRGAIAAMRADGTLPKAEMAELFARIRSDGHAVHVVYVAGEWLDVDDLVDLDLAQDFL